MNWISFHIWLLKLKVGPKVEVNQELKNKINEFYKLLKKAPDQSSSAIDFIYFLRSFLRIKSQTTLPTIEMMTVLKETKPIFY